MEQIWGFLVKFQVRRPVSRVLFLTKSVSKNGESRGGGHSSGAVVTQLPRCDLPRRRPEDGACVLSLGAGCGRLYLSPWSPDFPPQVRKPGAAARPPDLAPKLGRLRAGRNRIDPAGRPAALRTRHRTRRPAAPGGSGAGRRARRNGSPGRGCR